MRTWRRSTGWAAATLVAAAVLSAGVGRRGARAGDRDREALPTARVDSVRNFTLPDLDGKPRSLVDHRKAKAIVLAWTAPGCPVAMVYAPRLAELAKTYAAQEVAFLGVASDAGESLDDLRRLVKDGGTPYPVLLDADGTLAQALSIKTTTTAVVLDANWRVRYRGAVDDQYGVNGRKPAADHAWLKDALDAVLAARPVAKEATDAPGCPITFKSTARPGATTTSTWSGDVAKIVHARCATCHRENGGAPFGLGTYAELSARTAVVREVIDQNRMPPWHAVGEEGRFSNDRRLKAAEKTTLLEWLDAGAPEGDASKAPAPPPALALDAWEMGKPDQIFTFDKPQSIPAEGVVPYRFVTIPTKLTEDKWVKAVEVQPGAPGVVHHVLVGFDPPSHRGRGAVFAPWGGFFAAMVPGGRLQVFPDGMAKKLPAGTTLLFQMHYTPNGVATTDTTRIGLRYADKEPEREVKTAGVMAIDLRIPPGEANYKVRGQLPVPFNARILAFMPHMHVRGTSFRYSIQKIVGGGEETTLLEVPRYDFNWQTPYRLTTPIAVPRGYWLRGVATYDNSANNPYNPDPTAWVTWGDQTWDEMMIGYVDYVLDP